MAFSTCSLNKTYYNTAGKLAASEVGYYCFLRDEQQHHCNLIHKKRKTIDTFSTV
jgi:hypothetical protein